MSDAFIPVDSGPELRMFDYGADPGSQPRSKLRGC